MTESESDAAEVPGRKRTGHLDLFAGILLLGLVLLAFGPGPLFGAAGGCLLLAFFFALYENALQHYSAVRLTAAAKRAGREEPIRRALLHRDETILSSKLARGLTQVVGIGAFAVGLVQSHPSDAVAVAATLGAVVAFLVVNVAIAYLLGRWGGHRILVKGLVPYERALCFFHPAARGLQRLAARLMGAGGETDRSEELTDDILSAIEEGGREGVFADLDRRMLEGVIELRDVTADHIMTPRTEMVSIPVNATVEQAVERSRERGLSRLPVYRRSPDDIIGILYMKDLLLHLVGKKPPPPIEQILRPPFFVPESKNVRELLHEMKSRQVHLAVVLDEYGGTAGVVTIEDILEEIVGEIADEHEKANGQPVKKIGDNVATLDGKTHIDELNQALDLEVPENDEYETVGGLLFSRMGRVPAPGEHIDLDGVRFTVLEADARRVRRVKVTVQERAS